MMKRIYLCSRVAYDARPLNERVAQSLEYAGFEVYVPHREAPNNLSKEDIEQARYDVETIYKMDFAAMNRSDICVAVGRLGKDCSWELGWFYANGIPVYHIPDADETYLTSPMTLPTLASKLTVKDAAPFLASRYLAPQTVG